jgi:pimeloyl-ACP methyl ester carboxylesterase
MSLLATNAVMASSEGTQASDAGAPQNDGVEYGKNTLPLGVRSRRVDTNNGVVLHILESGFERSGKPCVVLLHGFPELAYCWRNQLLPLAREQAFPLERMDSDGAREDADLLHHGS